MAMYSLMVLLVWMCVVLQYCSGLIFKVKSFGESNDIDFNCSKSETIVILDSSINDNSTDGRPCHCGDTSDYIKSNCNDKTFCVFNLNVTVCDNMVTRCQYPKGRGGSINYECVKATELCPSTEFHNKTVRYDVIRLPSNEGRSQCQCSILGDYELTYFIITRNGSVEREETMATRLFDVAFSNGNEELKVTSEIRGNFTIFYNKSSNSIASTGSIHLKAAANGGNITIKCEDLLYIKEALTPDSNVTEPPSTLGISFEKSLSSVTIIGASIGGLLVITIIIIIIVVMIIRKSKSDPIKRSARTNLANRNPAYMEGVVDQSEGYNTEQNSDNYHYAQGQGLTESGLTAQGYSYVQVPNKLQRRGDYDQVDPCMNAEPGRDGSTKGVRGIGDDSQMKNTDLNNQYGAEHLSSTQEATCAGVNTIEPSFSGTIDVPPQDTDVSDYATFQDNMIYVGSLPSYQHKQSTDIDQGQTRQQDRVEDEDLTVLEENSIYESQK